ncbi:MAG: hypothetical protein ACQEXJ_08615 [Myxococcota bacterium]
MDAIDALFARFRAHVGRGAVHCEDVGDVLSGFGSGDVDLAVSSVCDLAADALVEDDGFWELAEEALRAIGEDASWIHQQHSRSRYLAAAGGFCRVWLGPSGDPMIRSRGPYEGGPPVPLGRREVVALADHLDRLAGDRSTTDDRERSSPPWGLELDETGRLLLSVAETSLSPGEARRLAAELRAYEPVIHQPGALDAESMVPPPGEPATIQRARAEWQDGRRAAAVRTWRRATGATLAEAKHALETS